MIRAALEWVGAHVYAVIDFVAEHRARRRAERYARTRSVVLREDVPLRGVDVRNPYGDA